MLLFISQQNSLFAQDYKAGKIAIGYNNTFTSNVNNFSLSFWLSNYIILETQLGFRHINISDNKGTSWNLGIGGLVTLKNFTVIPYLGGRFNTIIISGSTRIYNDLVFSAVFGAEYFISKWFSVGTEIQLNYIVTDKEFSPAYSIANATIIQSKQIFSIKIYFK